MGERHTGFLRPASQRLQGSAPPKPVCFPGLFFFMVNSLWPSLTCVSCPECLKKQFQVCSHHLCL